MQRRTLVTAVASLPALSMTSLATASNQPLLQALKPSSLMPVMFVGHGSPMNAIEDTSWRRNWQVIGSELLKRGEVPQLILCISAHWLTRSGWQVTGMAHPKTIHDFGGFPQELFDQQYPAPGAPVVANVIAGELKSPATGQTLQTDLTEWGLDHGTWSVLKPMFPRANIPVLQLSMDYSRPPQEHYALGQQLARLRSRGVLIVGSGNIVHNLRAVQPNVADNKAYDWAKEFDAAIGDQIAKGQLDALQNFLKLGDVAKMAHPTYEHFLPLLYAAGAARSAEMPRFFNTGFQAASISMRSVLWG
jgi:4,5-DOPA dioxygenase extradiol